MLRASQTLLPVYPPTRFKTFLLTTWAGRILIVNTLIFICLTYESGSILSPGGEHLLAFGVKDPVLVAQGQIFRLLTAAFVHIGIIHFALNSLAIFFIGYQIEKLVGPTWFLVIYFTTGFAGNVASANFNLEMSAGASGAIFGLLGVGTFLELALIYTLWKGQRVLVKGGVYIHMTVVNVIIGLLIPVIDDAAHLGGLFTGISLAFVYLFFQENKLIRRSPGLGALLSLGLAGLLCFGTLLASSPNVTVERLIKAGNDADTDLFKIRNYSRALLIDESLYSIQFERARILLLNGNTQLGLYDLAESLSDNELIPKAEGLVFELQMANKEEVAFKVGQIIQEAKISPSN